MVNKPLIRPSFWGCTLGGSRLTGHDGRVLPCFFWGCSGFLESLKEVCGAKMLPSTKLGIFSK